jgi:cellulose synthase/poly-beta-1,6-N-acetylglucosamine synthase-like glycosyltransferase
MHLAMAQFVFWIAAAALAYVYVGYPAGAWMLGRLSRRTVNKRPITPFVSVVVACQNEAAAIRRRVDNLLNSNYPAELLEIVVVSDGSTDATNETVRLLISDRVKLLELPERRGKAVALNAGVGCAAGDVIVFADARQEFERSAIRELVSNFADPSVGAVSGELVFVDSQSSPTGQGVGLYWSYERWIRKSESRFYSTVGSTGAIYAIRRELWKPIPAGTILDDVYVPMQIALRGYRVVVEEGARAYDTFSPSESHEFRRKVRTLTGNYQLCQLLPGVLLPVHRLFIQFWSHKLLRLAAPFFLLLLFAASLLARGTVYRVALAAQIGFYATVILGLILSGYGKPIRLISAAYLFSLMNAAAVMGLLHFVAGKHDVWAQGD